MKKNGAKSVSVTKRLAAFRVRHNRAVSKIEKRHTSSDEQVKNLQTVLEYPAFVYKKALRVLAD